MLIIIRHVPSAVKWENVTGGGNVGIMMDNVRNRTPEGIDGLSASANAALQKALAKKKEDRFATCSELVAALGCKARMETERKTEEKAERNARKGRWFVAVLAGLLVVGATCLALNGVYGRLVKGRGAYALRSVFLPAAGFGDGSYIGLFCSYGDYCSSTPYSDDSDYAWYLGFESGIFYRYGNDRDYGQSVRPLRVFAK